MLNSDNMATSHKSPAAAFPQPVSTSTQPVLSMFTQQSFSYMSMQPSLGPFDTSQKAASSNSLGHSGNSNNNFKTNSSSDPYIILLTRLLFHNSKNIRIGKHSVSLVLVEALYAVRGLEYLVSSRITRSNSTGSNNLPQPQPQVQAQPAKPKCSQQTPVDTKSRKYLLFASM